MAAVEQGPGNTEAIAGTELTCKHCGHTFTTRAKNTTHCPNCRAGARIKKGRAGNSGNAASPLTRAGNVAAPQVRVRPEPAPATAQVIPLHRNPPKTSVAAPDWTTPDPDNDDRADDDYYDDDDYPRSTYDQVRQAQLEAVAAAIRSNTRTHSGPAGAHQMGMLPRVLVEDSDTGSIVGTVVRRVVNRRGRPADNYRRCQHCGAIPGVSTPSIYRVVSPAMPEPRILCAAHAQQESVIPGCIVETL